MRGADERAGAMFSYVSLEARVPPDHPLRARQSTEAQTRRAGMRLDEKGRRAAQVAHRGGPLVSWIFTFAAAAYNIVRLRRLLPAPV